MKTILLIGEYSRLHNSLKEGLQKLGHHVILVSSGDGFKGYPADFSIEAKWCKFKIVHFFRQVLLKISGLDLQKLERGIRFYGLLGHFKNFDVVQLINETPIQTIKCFELFLLKKIFASNKKVFLLSCGVDYLSLQWMLANPTKKTILLPYFQDSTKRQLFDYVLEYGTTAHRKLHEVVYQNCAGIIASDIDYVLPLQGDKKFLGLIPNPINIEKLEVIDFEIGDKIVIFLGKNKWNALQKGTAYFEQALAMILKAFPNKVQVMVVENVPYQQYIKSYNEAHIVLDQMFGYDQGYNALEAMAKGKVVFTCAEKEFENQYALTEKVAINAKPDVDYLVKELTFLIENPSELYRISANARAFITQHHNYLKISEKYLSTWF